jgi:hypothetical protein
VPHQVPGIVVSATTIPEKISFVLLCPLKIHCKALAPCQYFNYRNSDYQSPAYDNGNTSGIPVRHEQESEYTDVIRDGEFA